MIRLGSRRDAAGLHAWYYDIMTSGLVCGTMLYIRKDNARDECHESTMPVAPAPCLGLGDIGRSFMDIPIVGHRAELPTAVCETFNIIACR